MLSPVSYQVMYSHDDGSRKVVGVVASIEGAEGQTEEEHEFQWDESERYKVSASGKLVPKTGPDYKAEIGEYLEAYYSPKATSQCP